MRVLLILNPNSTSQNAGLLRQVVPALRAAPGLSMEARMTQYPGHAEQMVAGMRRSDFDAVIAMGGDGTVNEIVNGLLGPVKDSADPGQRPRPEELPVLAIIPTGSANVFVRARGFPAGAVDATHVLARLLDRNSTRTICLGTWDDRWFAVNAGFGLDADVLARVDRARERGFAATPLRYLVIGVRAYTRALRRPPRINVVAEGNDGKRWEHENVPLMLASNTNPWTFLGPLPMVTNPRNSFDEGLGLFGLSSLQGVSGLVGMLHLIGVDHRRWLNKVTSARTLQFDDASAVTLSCPTPHRFQSDGESEGTHTRVQLRSVPDALEVFAPREAGEPHKRSVKEILLDLIRIK